MIKPELWTDEKLGECSVSARLLLIASLNFADDYGNLDRSARQLKAQAMPYDHIDCEPLIGELLTAGLIIEYKVTDRLYLHIKNFEKHQRIERKSAPRFPQYEDSLRTPQPLTEPSVSPHLVVTVLTEGKRREEKRIKSRDTNKRGARLPDDFTLTAERVRIAHDHNLKAEPTFVYFCNYWRAKAGAGAIKLDWDATWRNWCAKEQQQTPTRMNGAVNPDHSAEWAEAKSRAAAIGFRPPGSVESVGAYMTSIKLMENRVPSKSVLKRIDASQA